MPRFGLIGDSYCLAKLAC